MSLETDQAVIGTAAVDLMPAARKARKRPSRRRFWLRRTVVLLILVGIGSAGWLGVTAVLARKALLRAQTATAELRNDLERADGTRAASRLAEIRRDTKRARTLTASPVWTLAGRLPVAGETPRTVRGLAQEADVLSSRVLPRFVAIGALSGGGGLRDGDRVNIGALKSMNLQLAAATPELEGVVRRSQALPSGSLLTSVAIARQQLIDDAGGLLRTATKLRDATGIAPAMLGADGPRRYFVALQTNAELRGSGGLLGAYAILEADGGRLRLSQLGANKALRDTYPQTTDGLDADFAARYDAFGADGFWLNSNMSAHFPTVSKIWSSMYERSAGVHIDGSIAVDPIALAQILKATGPATGPGGESVSADNIVALTEQQIYARYPAYAQDALRNALQLDIARSLYDRLVAPVSHDVGLLPQLGAAAGGGHVHMASSHPIEQAIIERSSVGGALPAADGPYLQLALNNAGGTKLDYYLKTSIDYSFEAAHGNNEDVSMTVKLRSDAPSTGLPEYVVIRPDQPGNKSLIPGQNRLHVSIYGGRGATLRGAGLDGVPLQLDAGTEQGHPVWSAFITLDPGQERTIVVALTERGTDQHVTIVPPPTVTPATVQILGGLPR
ncbi:MAG: DUF4012 domain-containing protein [Actinomycetota bacterium]